MTDSDHAAALANLYGEAALRVNTRWARGRLERRSAQPGSSQALCVSAFETIAGRPEGVRWTVMNSILSAAGVGRPVSGAPTIETEVREHSDVLGETGGGTPTALDGLVAWPGGVLTIESKFGEPEFGGCGQVKPYRARPDDPRLVGSSLPGGRVVNCSGHHASGSDLKPTTASLNASCRLTVRDGRRAPRRYWEVAPSLFLPEVTATPRPCPFRGDPYQLMRNLAFAHEWRRNRQDDWFGFVVTLVDASPHAAALRHRVAEFKSMLLPEVAARVGLISYEQMANVLDTHGESPLAAWIRRRVERAFATTLGV